MFRSASVSNCFACCASIVGLPGTQPRNVTSLCWLSASHLGEKVTSGAWQSCGHCLSIR